MSSGDPLNRTRIPVRMFHRSGNLLSLYVWICVIVVINSSLKPVFSEQEVDFDFDDRLRSAAASDSLSVIDTEVRVRRSAETSDDEDLVQSDASGDDGGHETETGSGEVEYTTRQAQAFTTQSAAIDAPGVTGKAEQYRVQLNFTDLPYSRDLRDPHSSDFRRLSKDLSLAVESLYADTPGRQTANIVEYRSGDTNRDDPPYVLVSLDLSSLDFYNRISIFNTLNASVNRGYIGHYRVSPHGIAFKPLGEAVQPSACSPWDFQCFDGPCIPSSLKCNGKYDCTDKSDEYDCDCSLDQFECSNGQCVPATAQCNGTFECSDASDEDNCVKSCSIHEFKCGSGECVDARGRCDHRRDCKDGSDEQICGTEAPETCAPNEFSCDNGNCIFDSRVCDSYDDCGDGSDERNCPTAEQTCGQFEFRCNDGTCIENRRKCDHVYDCKDASDEISCDDQWTTPSTPRTTTPAVPICSSHEFRCSDGICIDSRLKCDGKSDCYDRSDEFNCGSPTSSSRCQPNHFECRDGTCIPNKQRCDNRRDCPDGEDETFECGLPIEQCHILQRQCRDGTCISRELWCDRTRDCPDGSDEDLTTCDEQHSIIPTARPLCSDRYEFTCRDGTCIDISRKCDRSNDCPDGSDELDCEIHVSERPVKCSNDEFECRNGLCISRKHMCDHRNDCSHGEDEENCPSRLPAEQPPHACNPVYQFTCQADGTCISLSQACDAVRDCADGSDEANCDISRCTWHQFTCDDGTCVEANQKCDKNWDCPDYSDEENCPDNETRRTYPTTSPSEGHQCGHLEFRCGDGACIDSSKRCDRQYDCRDYSDERDCDERNPVPPTRAACSSHEFKCRDGTCIDSTLRCNRQYDCRDGTDEFDCDQFTRAPAACSSHEYKCGDGSCIDATLRCNRHYDCRDGTDEFDCDQLTRAPGACTSREFKCADGSCIEANLRCNRHYDCRDGTDEFDCEQPRGRECSRFEYRCQDGTCLDESLRCNRRYDCPDGSDEFDCVPTILPTTPSVCSEHEFRCDDGHCIDRRNRCDRKYHCTDGTDEFNCDQPGVYTERSYTERHTGGCGTYEWRCNDGECIDDRLKCDGRPNCRDGSDEWSCPHVDVPNTHPTWSGPYTERSYTEHQPGGCGSYEWRCNDGECIDDRLKCNGRPDCRDGSDEWSCPQLPDPYTERSYTERQIGGCGTYEWRCNDGECIDDRLKCNGRPDCRDGSDEWSCPQSFTQSPWGQPTQPPAERGCRSDEYQCHDGSCIDARLKCNGYQECRDGTDEFFCDTTTQRTIWQPTPGYNPSCQSYEFRCSDGSCIDARLRCNGYPECRDGSDETSCDRRDSFTREPINTPSVRLIATPSDMTIREGATAAFVCRAHGGAQPQLRWSKSNQALPYQAVDDYSGRLTISNVAVADSGDYICTASDTPGAPTASVRLNVDLYGPPPTKPPPRRGNCGSNEMMCDNGICVPADYRCDGDYDCTDRSDEQRCEANGPCEPNEFRCANHKCIMKIWVCDGDDDCGGDNSDEANCDALVSVNTICAADEFQCQSDNLCMPAGFWCDGERDCQDGSDEAGCTRPTATKPPPPELMANLGERFDIVCEAIGVPTPTIVWRLNWGHIGEPPRVTTIVEKVKDFRGGPVTSRGTLTIRDAKKEDEGAYTCEALNSMGNIMVDPDTIVHIIPPSGICRTPYYNEEAASQNECIKCFCFGLTDSCSSSNLYKSKLFIGSELPLVDRRDQRPFTGARVEFNQLLRQFSIRDYSRTTSGGQYYFSLPSQFLGNKVTSYGGEITYNVFYSASGSPAFERGPDIIIHGNEATIYSTHFTTPFSGNEKTAKVSIKEGSWSLDEFGSRQATREDIMKTLQDVDYILIKSNYDRYQDEVRLGSLTMSSAADRDAGEGRAVEVEKCNCPPGYAGTSCEQCATGYSRSDRPGRYLGECIQGGEGGGSIHQCNCNGRSNQCDQRTGACLNCADFTEGSQCERCKAGYYDDSYPGSALRCLPCPCPLTQHPNQFATSCRKDSDGRVTCQGCPPGYTGRQCETCAPGYEGQPSRPGDSCRPSHGGTDNAAGYCDPKGSASVAPDPYTGQCTCKQFAEGPVCGSCKANSFYPSESNPLGCIPCFCMGVTQSCSSTRFGRTKVTASLNGAHGFIITDRDRMTEYSDGVTVDPQGRQIVFRDFARLPPSQYYWSLPEKFLKNKITSYGGNLKFTIQHLPGFDTSPTNYPDVEISGNDIVLEHNFPQPIQANTPTTLTIPFYEDKWRRADGAPATREHLMMVLADLEFILIKAKYAQDTVEISLKDISLDIAENRNTGFERAHAVEECNCPTGYRGLSCEECDSGYRRSGGGLYLGLCEPASCDCNGHSDRCDPRTGECTDCQHNTVGERCDRCAPGYYGDPSRGSACQPCPCPLTSSSNQFTQTCRLDYDGQVTCSGCPPGYTGRRCESCAAGYRGNPSSPGDYCRPDDSANIGDQKPQVVIRPTQLSLSIGADVTFECNVRGQGPFNVQWIRYDGRPLPDRSVIGRDNSLRIKNLQPSDAGRYICVAVNAFGRTQVEADLSIASQRQLTVNVREPKQLTSNVGATVEFYCFGDSPNVYTVAWGRKDGQQMSHRAVDDGQGHLTIQQIERQDEGTYRCTGSDFYSLATDEAVLIVSEGHGGGSSQPVRIDPPAMNVRAGDRAEFRCVAPGYPPPRIIWSWSRGDRLPQGAVADGDLLRFYSVRPEDSGEYYCQVHSSQGVARVAANLYVQGGTHGGEEVSPGGDPDVEISQPDVRVRPGEDARVECKSRTNVRVDSIDWTREGGQLPPGSYQSSGQLVIPRCRKEYEGRYTCTIYFVDGDKKLAHMRLQISDNDYSGGHQQPREEAPQLELDTGSGTVEVPSGQTHATYTCRVTAGSPTPSVTWVREDGAPPTRNTDIRGGVLRFNQLTREEEGTYVCEARNSAGHARVSLTLRLSGGDSGQPVYPREARITIKPSSPLQLSAGQRLVAECVVDNLPGAEVAWYSPANQELAKSQYGNVRLDIPSVGGHHTGSYWCIARSHSGSAQQVLQVNVVDYNVGDGQWTTRGPYDDRRDVDAERIEHMAVNVIPQQIRVSRGESAEFRCTAIGYPPPVIEWTRVDGPMPYYHRIHEGILRIDRVEAEDSGTYRCAARSQAGSGNADVRLSVTSVPVITLHPRTQTLRPGDMFRIQCTADGTEPISLEWSKVDGQLSPAATDRYGLLEIVSVSAADAGRYRCVAVSDSGRSQQEAELQVLAPPSAIISPRTAVAGSGETVEFNCEVTGSPLPRVQWQKETGNLPERHNVQNNRLILYNVQEQDAGRYICTVANEVGTTRDFASLTLSAASSNGENIFIRERKETVTVGDQVEIECTAAGQPTPVVKWIKVDGEMTAGVRLRGNRLEIQRITEDDQGIYRCVATSIAGTVYDQVTINVEAPPVVPLTHQSRTVSLGSSVTLACQARGNPKPQVSWSRRTGELPRGHEARNGVLIIPAIREEDFGEYICTANNKYGDAEGVIVLQQGELVPYLAQNPKSYLAYKGIKEPYETFDLEVSFKPQTSDGLILYTGKSMDGSGGDFVSFGLRQRRAEFRLDVGSGPGIVTTDPLELDKWNTVRIKREGKEAVLFVNGKEYKGEAPGAFIGLDVTETSPLYVGGVPDFTMISKLANFSQGFVGCISRLLVSGSAHSLGGDYVGGEGITDCPVCQYRPCEHGGQCRPAATKTGYRCACAKGYSGLQCQQIGEKCSPGICGDQGKCYDLPNGQGYKCSCPVGMHGLNCEQGRKLNTPKFNYTSYATYQTLQDALNELQMMITFKADTLDDAILLYDAHGNEGISDYVSLTIKDGGHVVFQFDTGSGPAVIKSDQPIKVGEWTTASVERNQKDGSLTINNKFTVKGHSPLNTGSSPGDTVGLNLNTPLYVGGVNHSLVRVTPSVGVTEGFIGCIAKLKIGELAVNLIHSAIDYHDIEECENGRKKPCASQPCHNNAVCQETNGWANVTDRHFGTTVSPTASPGTGFTCHCPLGYGGELCDERTVIGKSASFNSTSYLELPSTLLPHKSTLISEEVELTVSTTEADALLLWHGQMPTTPGRGKDYMAIALEGGRAVFSFQLGSGVANITSDEVINDGLPHHIIAVRTGKEGSLEIDGFSSSTGKSPGDLSELDTVGNIYLGGTPNLALMTGGRFKKGLVGCLSNVHLMGEGPLDLTMEAVKGLDVQPCDL